MWIASLGLVSEEFPDPSTDDFWDGKHFECHALCYTVCLVRKLD